MIIYKNGQVESFNDVSNTEATASTQPENSSQTNINNNKKLNNGVVRLSVGKVSLFTLYGANNKVIKSKQSYKALLPYVKDDEELMGAYKRLKTANTVSQVYSLGLLGLSILNIIKLNKPDSRIGTLEYVTIGALLVDFVVIYPYVKSKAKSLANTYNEKKSNGV